MQFQVTDIEFDFTLHSNTWDLGGAQLADFQQQEVYEEIIGTFWEADDADDLIEEITCAAGWCIKSIDYRHVLN